jgi:hypothetical protein
MRSADLRRLSSIVDELEVKINAGRCSRRRSRGLTVRFAGDLSMVSLRAAS